MYTVLSEIDMEELIDKYFHIKLFGYTWEDECKFVIRRIEEKVLKNYLVNERFKKKK